MKEKEEIVNSEEDDNSPLFRQEAVDHKKGSFLGNVSIICPIAYRYWSGGILILALLLILFLIFGEYSKHHQARGILLPNKGLIQIYPQNVGVVLERFVKQGDHVEKNQPLYRISMETHDQSQLSLVRQQINTLEQQLGLSKRRVLSAKNQLEKYQKLLNEKYIAQTEYQSFYDFCMEKEIEQKTIEQQLIHARSSLEHLVLATEKGLISNTIAVVGDRVTVDKALCTIIPEDALLEGIMFVPSRDIGFVKLGQTILLKYDAYPYQNFGLHQATVESISENALSQKEYDFPISPNTQNPYLMESYYRVVVQLRRQVIRVYGKDRPLNTGMAFLGEIIGEKRKIWQWLLEPLYTLKSSLVTHE